MSFRHPSVLMDRWMGRNNYKWDPAIKCLIFLQLGAEKLSTLMKECSLTTERLFPEDFSMVKRTLRTLKGLVTLCSVFSFRLRAMVPKVQRAHPPVLRFTVQAWPQPGIRLRGGAGSGCMSPRVAASWALSSWRGPQVPAAHLCFAGERTRLAVSSPFFSTGMMGRNAEEESLFLHLMWRQVCSGATGCVKSFAQMLTKSSSNPLSTCVMAVGPGVGGLSGH